MRPICGSLASISKDSLVRVINFSDRIDKSRHDQMVKLGEQMLALQC